MIRIGLFRILLLAVCAVIVAATSACNQCTLAGCAEYGGLVRLEIRDPEDRLVTEFDLEIEIDGVVESISCPQSSSGRLVRCVDDGQAWIETRASSIRLEVTSVHGSFDGNVEPDYIKSYPNGEVCGPECLNAEASLQLTL